MFLRFTLVFWLLVGFLEASAHPSLRLETYGDSLTAGFLANTSLVNPPEIGELSQILNGLAFGFIERKREVLKKFEANDKAWPHFLSQQLRKVGKNIRVVENLAVSGSKSAGILAQVQASGATTQTTWAFFFVGHNDLCHIKGDVPALAHQFNSNLEGALAEWEKNHADSVVFLIPPGPIYQLYPVLDNYTWFESGKKTFKCQDAWAKYFPYCASFYLRHKQGGLENYLKPRVEVLNRSLDQIALENHKKSVRGNQYFYLKADWPLPLRPDYFALDCYHIAEEGQKIFARNVFEAIRNTLPNEF